MPPYYNTFLTVHTPPFQPYFPSQTPFISSKEGISMRFFDIS